MPQGRDLVVLGVKNLNVGICDGATSTARSSFFYYSQLFLFSFYLIRVLNSSRSSKAFCKASSQIRIHTVSKGYINNNNNTNNNNNDRQFKEDNTQNKVTRYIY